MTGGQPYRNESGGLIDRSRPVRFRFDGRSYGGFEGDTLASALLANGVRLVGRSFKYHRPRGILTASSAEPNALVELRTGGRLEPNTRATTVELFDGLEAKSQNRWPSLAWDVLSVNSLFFSPFLVAGFYYKTFKWPAGLWEPVYERFIRRAAGLGHAAAANDPDAYEKAHAHCDVLVIGGGPAGLAAALRAGRAGARVILADEEARFGGGLLSERVGIGDEPGGTWVERVVRELAALQDVRPMLRTTVVGRYDGGTYAAVERVSDHLPEPRPYHPRQRLWRIYARRVVLASGAGERSIAFAGNDVPGVMLASAARTYANRFGVRAGDRAVVFGCGDDIYRTARDLADAGTQIAAIVDSRTQGGDGEGLAPVFAGHLVSRAVGGRRVRAAEIRRNDDRLAYEQIPCDVICMAGGWNPNIQIATHLGQRPQYDEARGCFVMPEICGELALAGSAAGHDATQACISSGAEAGRRAAEAAGCSAGPFTVPTVEEGPFGRFEARFRVRSELGKAFVDFQNDVTDKDVELAVREGYDTAEHAKRYTTLGMATDQGKTGGVGGSAVLAEAVGGTIAEVGVTTARPPYVPVSFGALAGHSTGKHFAPTRLTPMHAWHEAHGAEFIEAGLWLRPQYYVEGGDSDWLTNAKREVLATRCNVGLCDVSTLGKIDIQGPDAAEFLNRLYINGWKKLEVGKARYGLMLREDGFVMDDGTTSRLGPDHFLMTTTTAGAGGVMAHIEFCHQVIWPDLDVQYVSVTEQWAQMAIAGPKSRQVLEAVVDHTDLANEAFPFMAARDLTILGGLPARLFRISFSGELAYELAVPADYGTAVWQALMETGRPQGITPYGLEALSIMRVEKGHPAGQELDGRTTADDLGLGRMMSGAKDFVGKALAGREALKDPERAVLVGLSVVDHEDRLTAGAHLLGRDARKTANNDQGWVSSVAFSPMLGHWIGLAFLKAGRTRYGERLLAVDFLRGIEVEVEVTSPVFYDRKGEKLHG